MKKIAVSLTVIAWFLSVAACPITLAGDAMDDLEGMTNTGTTFDGSDGQRSGMDIDFTPTTTNIPEPTAEPVFDENE